MSDAFVATGNFLLRPECLVYETCCLNRRGRRLPETGQVEEKTDWRIVFGLPKGSDDDEDEIGRAHV